MEGVSLQKHKVKEKGATKTKILETRSKRGVLKRRQP